MLLIALAIYQLEAAEIRPDLDLLLERLSPEAVLCETYPVDVRVQMETTEWRTSWAPAYPKSAKPCRRKGRYPSGFA